MLFHSLSYMFTSDSDMDFLIHLTKVERRRGCLTTERVLGVGVFTFSSLSLFY